ncbi:MAG: peptidase M20, partial [Acidobacteria bacterium]|nr:peptidase M20 [Acidobacteriota bacterium]
MLQEYLDTHKQRLLDELLTFLRIPSISTLPEHRDDVIHAARFVADAMSGAGLENIEIIPTDGHPLVYGDWLHA